ncbi:OmpH family outer membrane protein [Treponema zuelzerae]|uniref:OmpH family outer membrane protein n=1 Tax=Teretinema zuelzerae TaxID=156 RepID=A0AAE3JIZ6_9SPIR|nr:OmpH family outer membrane protein [Teretinema zuelzerae]MBN2810364.1 OmpH family outer membrane protein [Spirochaetales bacterium]MCD1654776.1 OmpH family outer membrane protein [Teretinema zuelzerae]HPO02251.1 OmpH family outer membrane protein [Treponemataceae bacterium]
MSDKKIIIGLLIALFSASLFSQQITRFGVVDTSRIYTAFYRDSRNVRDYEAKKEQYQGEIKRMSEEVKNLRQKKVDAETVGDNALSARLSSEIDSKTSVLLEYSKVKNAELDALKKRLVSDDDFYSMLYDEIKKISEADGYSMVLSLQEGNSILWYSPTVDITEKVIRSLTGRR